MSSLVSFFKDLKLLPHRSFTCLVRVTPRYFMLLVKGDVSLISFSVHLSYVYRRATGFFFVNLVSCYITEGVIGVPWYNFWGHLCILSYHQQIVKV